MAKQESPELARANVPTLDGMHETVLTIVARQADEGTDVGQELAARVLNASTAEDILAEDTLAPSSEYIGKTFLVTQVDWRHSDIADGPGYFAVVHATIKQGQPEVTFGIGGLKPMAQLYQLDSLGFLPKMLTLKEIGKAKPGQSAPTAFVEPQL